MIRLLILATLLLATGTGGCGCTRSRDVGPSVRILTYSSLGAKGGFLPSVRDRFEKESGCSLAIESTLGATQMISILADQKLRKTLDVVMGVDELLYERLKEEWVADDFAERNLRKKLVPLLVSRMKPGWIPLDFGALTLIYRKSAWKGETLPKTVRDLLSPGMRKKFIVQDPRASSPGAMFFLFAGSGIGIGELRSSWLALAPSWDSSYQMFLSGDAPMVWSYLSSLAYHASKGERAEYGAVDFEEGLPLQVEGMGILKPGGTNPCVPKWIDFMLNPAILAEIARKQWMFPAFQDVALPEYFDQIPALKKAAPVEVEGAILEKMLSDFARETSK